MGGNVVFNPFQSERRGASKPPLQPANSNKAPEQRRHLQRVQVTDAHYAMYPPHTVQAGTVGCHAGARGERGDKCRGLLWRVVNRITGAERASKAVKILEIYGGELYEKQWASDVVVGLRLCVTGGRNNVGNRRSCPRQRRWGRNFQPSGLAAWSSNKCRGRDDRRRSPPAQIRTSASTHTALTKDEWRRSGHRDRGAELGVEESTSSGLG